MNGDQPFQPPPGYRTDVIPTTPYISPHTRIIPGVGTMVMPLSPPRTQVMPFGGIMYGRDPGSIIGPYNVENYPFPPDRSRMGPNQVLVDQLTRVIDPNTGVPITPTPLVDSGPRVLRFPTADPRSDSAYGMDMNRLLTSVQGTLTTGPQPPALHSDMVARMLARNNLLDNPFWQGDPSRTMIRNPADTLFVPREGGPHRRFSPLHNLNYAFDPGYVPIPGTSRFSIVPVTDIGPMVDPRRWNPTFLDAIRYHSHIDPHYYNSLPASVRDALGTPNASWGRYVPPSRPILSDPALLSPQGPYYDDNLGLRYDPVEITPYYDPDDALDLAAAYYNRDLGNAVESRRNIMTRVQNLAGLNAVLPPEQRTDLNRFLGGFDPAEAFSILVDADVDPNTSLPRSVSRTVTPPLSGMPARVTPPISGMLTRVTPPISGSPTRVTGVPRTFTVPTGFVPRPPPTTNVNRVTTRGGGGGGGFGTPMDYLFMPLMGQQLWNEAEAIANQSMATYVYTPPTIEELRIRKAKDDAERVRISLLNFYTQNLEGLSNDDLNMHIQYAFSDNEMFANPLVNRTAYHNIIDNPDKSTPGPRFPKPYGIDKNEHDYLMHLLSQKIWRDLYNRDPNYTQVSRDLASQYVDQIINYMWVRNYLNNRPADIDLLSKLGLIHHKGMNQDENEYALLKMLVPSVYTSYDPRILLPMKFNFNMFPGAPNPGTISPRIGVSSSYSYSDSWNASLSAGIQVMRVDEEGNITAT